MKFSEEQIKKLIAIRIEFVEKIRMFITGIQYAKRIFAPNEDCDFVWICEVQNNISDLYIEEMTILDDINITDLEETEFYVCLGQYFERIHNSWKWDENNPTGWFETMFNKYKKDIIQALKS